MNKNKETKNQKMDKIIKELESKSSPMLFLLNDRARILGYK